MVWLLALVGRQRRVEVSALHLADHAEDRPVSEVRLPLQDGGKVEQECVTACHSQRASRLEDSGELGIGKRDRRHGGGFRGGYSPAYAIWRP
jgi:hypothetical protein